MINFQFGWVLKRTLRGSGISTADIIIISENKSDTDPQMMLGFLKKEDLDITIKSKISELGRLESELRISLGSFVSQLQVLSECIDLDIPYNH